MTARCQVVLDAGGVPRSVPLRVCPDQTAPHGSQRNSPGRGDWGAGGGGSSGLLPGPPRVWACLQGAQAAGQQLAE